MHHQSLLSMSEDNQLVLSHNKLPLKRKRAQDDAAQNCNRCPDSSSPERKKLKISEENSALKRRYSQISRGSQSISETSESAPLIETKKKEDQRVANIWIIGSSYIRRGERGAREKFGDNFGLNAKVQWFGKGGMRWNGVLPRFYAELSTQSPPDILVVHAGGNDLGLVSAQGLSNVMKKELMQLHTEFPSMKIVYSCINERQVWRYGSPGWINLDRKAVNSIITKTADCFGGVVIEHPCLRYFDKAIFVPDGVHFTRKGNELFVTNIHSAIKKLLRQIRFEASASMN